MYKIELFDSKMNFQCAHFFDTGELSLDYLTLDATAITVAGKCNAQKGSFAHITGQNQLVFDGIVSDIQPDKGFTNISIRPLQALFDFEAFTNNITYVASWMLEQITAAIVENADTLQNRPLIISNTATNYQRPITTEQNKCSLIEIMSIALTTYQIAVNCKIDMAQKKIVTVIEQITDIKTIEADLDNVISKEITLGDSYGSFNKAIIRKISTDSETGVVSILDTVPFYLHTNGTVSATDNDRVTPVFFTIEDLENSENWNNEALAKATELLTPQQFDNEINLTYQRQDKLCAPEQLQIGTCATIYTGGKAYTSILTGKIFAKDTVQLVFGAIRVDLTKKLILERRKQ